MEECTSESEIDDENDASNEEEWTSSNEAKSDCSDKDEVDVHAKAEAALKKLVPLEEFSKVCFFGAPGVFFIFNFSTLSILWGLQISSGGILWI